MNARDEPSAQATPARGELAEKWRADLTKVHGDELTIELRRRSASELLELLSPPKPRTVNSASELDALPVGSVILLDAGRYGANAWQKRTNGRWCEASHYEESMTSTELRVGSLPATVLFTPGDAG